MISFSAIIRAGISYSSLLMHFKSIFMSKKINHHTFFIPMLVLITIGILASCKKGSLSNASSADGQIAFFNASAQLLNDLGYSGSAYVLKDITDTTYKPASPADNS